MEKVFLGGIDMWGNIMATQSLLDQLYIKRHGVKFEELPDQRILALTDELMEYAKETRCFHYWSVKDPAPDHVRLEEAADCIHFYASLGVQLGVNPDDFVEWYGVALKELPKNETKLKVWRAFHFRMAIKRLPDLRTNEQYIHERREALLSSFSHFWQIIRLDGFTEQDIERAYYLKNEKNRKRMDHGL